MRRRSKVAIGVAIGAIVGLAIAWPATAASASHGVVITTDARPLTCADSADVKLIKYQKRWVQAVVLGPKINCTLRIRILNDGWLPVDISSLHFVNFGRDSDWVDIDNIDGLPSLGYEDAVGGLDDIRSLAPGEVTIMSVHMTAPRLQCMGQGVTALLQHTPRLGVSALGLSIPRTPTDLNVAFIGTRASYHQACDDGESIPTNKYDDK